MIDNKLFMAYKYSFSKNDLIYWHWLKDSCHIFPGDMKEILKYVSFN